MKDTAQHTQITLSRPREVPLTKQYWAWFLGISNLKFYSLFAGLTVIAVISPLAGTIAILAIPMYLTYVVLFLRAILWR
jgi:hypothetical protein